jgi:hypothetical protein
MGQRAYGNMCSNLVIEGKHGIANPVNLRGAQRRRLQAAYYLTGMKAEFQHSNTVVFRQAIVITFYAATFTRAQRPQ